MMESGGAKWFTAGELADLGLPGLSRSKRKINERSAEEGWAIRTDHRGAPLARPRRARGGGLEYHLSVLPASARIALIKAGLAQDATVSATPPVPADAPAPQTRWTWFEGQTAKTKDEAKRRLRVLDAVARLERAGCTRTLAISGAADEHGVSKATIWNWLALVEGVPANDWLPHLAPNRAGGGAETPCDERVWQVLKSDYLRPEKPSWSSCIDRAAEVAASVGVTMPHARTLWRRFEREIDPRLVIAKRSGADALRGTIPYQQRSVDELHALELVNIDGHKMDVFVRFEDGTIGRPTIVAIQDVFSRKIIAWRIGTSEDAVLTRFAFADLFARYGIPKGCLLDNGRAFASKWITGGAKSRFRFKIKEEEPTGLLTALGIAIHWAKPYRGSSKPIERAFRDFCDAIAKHPAYSGAYTGNRPDAKPENYGAHAVPIDLFARVFAKGVAAHNAKPGRRGGVCRGRSFDQVFEASYAASPIGRATAEQLRLALLTADDSIRTHRSSGEIALFGNRYWVPELAQIAGTRVTVRFDPDNLQTEVHVYARDGRFLATAPVVEATGFLDVASAKTRAKAEGDLRKAVRAVEAAEDLLTAQQIAAMLPDDDSDDAAFVPTIVRPVRHRGQTAAALKPQHQAQISGAPRPDPNSVIDRIGRLKLVT